MYYARLVRFGRLIRLECRRDVGTSVRKSSPFVEHENSNTPFLPSPSRPADNRGPNDERREFS